MCSHYTTQIPSTLFNNATLTTAYSGNRTVMDISGMSKLSLDVDYARGAGEAASALNLTVEHSIDGTDWVHLSIDSTDTVSTITERSWVVANTSKVNIFLDVAYKFVRVSVREAGVTTNAGTVTVKALASGL